MSDAYLALMRRRGHLKSAAPPEQSWRCLCCRDSGLVPVDIVIRYLPNYRPDLVDEAQLLGPTSTPIACDRPSCHGDMTYISTVEADDDGNETQATTPRRKFPYAVVESLTPQLCTWIHESEFKRLQDEQPAPLKPAIAASVATIGQPMPAATPESHPLEHAEHPEPDEVAGIHRGDRVIIATDESTHNGHDGIVRGFTWQQSQGAYVAFVEMADGAIELVNPVFLEMESAA